MINVFTLASGREEPSYSLLGHSENVCALDATASGLIISGSWDKSAHHATRTQLKLTYVACLGRRGYGRASNWPMS